MEKSIMSSVRDMVSLTCCRTFRWKCRSGARGGGAGDVEGGGRAPQGAERGAWACPYRGTAPEIVVLD